MRGAVAAMAAAVMAAEVEAAPASPDDKAALGWTSGRSGSLLCGHPASNSCTFTSRLTGALWDLHGPVKKTYCGHHLLLKWMQ